MHIKGHTKPCINLVTNKSKACHVGGYFETPVSLCTLLLSIPLAGPFLYVNSGQEAPTWVKASICFSAFVLICVCVCVCVCVCMCVCEYACRRYPWKLCFVFIHNFRTSWQEPADVFFSFACFFSSVRSAKPTHNLWLSVVPGNPTWLRLQLDDKLQFSSWTWDFTLPPEKYFCPVVLLPFLLFFWKTLMKYQSVHFRSSS